MYKILTKRKITSGATVYFLFILNLWVQSVQHMEGTAKSDQGEFLPGISILVEGTRRGTVTDLDGTFSINASENETLSISGIGFATQTA